MNKRILRILSILLALCMVFDIMPMSVLAAPANTSENAPVLLGTETEYATTFGTMFDENGLRKVTVGFNSNNGVVGKQVGLVNKYGDFVVQPIYDEIKLHAKDERLGSGTTTLPLNFIGGYTQAVRDGKMGLLNTRGEEVVPCRYDFVQMPSEGVSAVYQKISDGKYYLGYWNLEQNREIVAPNKYITAYTGTAIGIKGDVFDHSGKKKPAGDYLSVHDFISGYALVTLGTSNANKVSATIIDKNGKEVLPKSYFIMSNLLAAGDYNTYPQKGAYLSFVEEKNVADYRFTKLNNEWGPNKTHKLSSNSTYATGLAGTSGILIPASYTTGVLASPGEASFFINPAKFQIILDKGLILTQKDELQGYLYGGTYGVIDLKGKVVLPFTHLVNQELYYFPNEAVFKGHTGTLYNIQGKKLKDYEMDWFYNGYATATKTGAFNSARDTYSRTHYVVKANGTQLDITKTLGLDPFHRTYDCSNVSVGGYFWVKNNSGKWGLLNFGGKTILPFEYEQVNHTAWAEGENGFARVTKNGKLGMVNAQGKMVLPCTYNKIDNPSENSSVVIVENQQGKGIVDVKTGKIILPTQYSKLGAFANFKQKNDTLFSMGVYYGEKDGKNLLLDAGGNTVFSTSKKFMEAIDGLYHFNDNSGYFNNRGKVIFTDELFRTKNVEIGSSYTIYIKDGKVYRISANHIESTYAYKPYGQNNAVSAANMEAYAQGKRDAHIKAYEQASGNPYVQKPTYKEDFIRFVNVPTTVIYEVGAGFERAGFKAEKVDTYGKATDISNDIIFKVNGNTIDEGYAFKEVGNKKVDCYYKGEKLNYFTVTVIKNADDYLANGNYYMQIYGKYITPVYASGTYWLELSDKKPSKPFTVELQDIDANRGPCYHIMYDGAYIMQPTTKQGAQLKSTNGVPHKWRINEYSSFCTIRDYGNQKLIVNASGQSSKNGTKVIIWGDTGKAPDNAKITFTKVN